jgi:hypothetical protein
MSSPNCAYLKRDRPLRKTNAPPPRPAQGVGRVVLGSPCGPRPGADLALEVVALDHDTVRRLLPLDLFEPRHRAARDVGDPQRERRRIVLLGDAVLVDVAVEVFETGHTTPA